MIFQFTNSVKDNFIQRTTNPFLGTLLVVWIIRNWRFVYSLFYFDDTFTLDSRLEKIAGYFKYYTIWDFLWTVAIAFIVLVSTYLLINLSRLIINFFDKIITPRIYNITDKSSIVLKEDFLKEVKRGDLLETKFKEEKDKRRSAEERVEQLELELAKPASMTNTQWMNPARNKWIVGENDKEEEVSSNSEDGRIKQLHNILKRRNLSKDFIKCVFEIANHMPLDPQSDAVREFLIFGLIERTDERSSNGNFAFYHLTVLGENLRKEVVVEDFK